jgi:excisionase family DNA binding protein
MTEPALRTTAEAAERLKVSTRTILRMVEDGRLTAAQKLAGETSTYLFTEDEIERVAAGLAASA